MKSINGYELKVGQLVICAEQKTADFFHGKITQINEKTVIVETHRENYKYHKYSKPVTGYVTHQRRPEQVFVLGSPKELN